MAYKHLSEDERYHIYELKLKGLSARRIALRLQRHHSTIGRELRRNCTQLGYRPKQAQQNARLRAKNCVNGPRIPEKTWAISRALLKQEWSPEQISKRLKQDHLGSISHESIYQRVYSERLLGGKLFESQRFQRKRRRRVNVRRNRLSSIPNRVSIDSRPAIVDRKKRLGDWEGDTMVGKNYSQAIVTLVERHSKLTVLYKVKRKSKAELTKGIIQQLKPYEPLVKTITFDNGTEFAGHELIAEKLNAKMYFVHPYSSWERGLNENTNGLLRQYFPKGTSFSKISQKKLEQVANRLNNRPRETLGFQTPNEVFTKKVKQLGVALRI